ncbi:MAG: orotate phosphoribosyltransferase [Elusimicrobiota bacterium]|jgi:orotate phosphoribosyltransferase
MLSDQEIRAILEESGALLSGHFKLSSGRHSGHYLQCAQVLQHPDKAELLCRTLAEKCSAHGVGIENRIHTVASPAVGGLVIGQELARALKARSVFAERGADGKMAFRRGFKLAPRETVLLADDVLTTGGSLRELFELAQAQGARVVGVAAAAERGFHDKTFKVPRDVLIKLDFQDYEPAECPLCRQGLPIDKPGSRPAA